VWVIVVTDYPIAHAAVSARVAVCARTPAPAPEERPGNAPNYGHVMAYIITEPCIGTKDKSCVDVCPVDCIHGSDDDKMLFIDPEVCIDCGACVSACPVEAIYADSDIPEKWTNFIQINADYFKVKS
jgi:ferredoxin